MRRPGRNGYRNFDVGYMYHKEVGPGEGIRRSGVPCEKRFICTRLYPCLFSDAENAIDTAFGKPGVGYMDLMLLHRPGTNDAAACKAMERAVAAGKIRSVGLLVISPSRRRSPRSTAMKNMTGIKKND